MHSVLRSAAQGFFRSPFRRRSSATAVAGEASKAARPWADYVPVYGALGATALSVTLGLGTAGHQLAHAPNVRLDKRKREAVPEVAEPELAVGEAERLRGRSLFRRLARAASGNGGRFLAAGPVAEKKAVTLKDAGVDPPGIERSREDLLGNFCKSNSF